MNGPRKKEQRTDKEQARRTQGGTDPSKKRNGNETREGRKRENEKETKKEKGKEGGKERETERETLK